MSYELVAPYSEGGVNYISTAAGKLNLIRVHRTKVIFLVQAQINGLPLLTLQHWFLSDPGIPGVRSMGV